MISKILFLCFYFFLLNASFLDAQQLSLSAMRRKYCGKYCKLYQRDLINKRKSLPPLPSRKSDPKKMFSIPAKQRLRIYPFSVYDTIYIATPNILKDTELPRNFIDKKYHYKKEVLTNSQKNKLTDILFNYYVINNFYSYYDTRNYVGCNCLAREYPRLLLFFQRNGHIEKYISLPYMEDGYNFTDKDLEPLGLDWWKIRKICELFEDFVNKNTQPYECEQSYLLYGREPIRIKKDSL